MAWVRTALESEFFWGIIVGLILTVVGSYFLALFTARQQQQERKDVLRNFCMDTVINIRQIIEDMDTTRSKARLIHHDYLVLFDVEYQVFTRNREHLIYLPLDVRDKVRRFITDCAIRRAEIGNYLTTFNNQWNLAGQLEAQGHGPEAERARSAANVPLTQAHKALDALVLRAKDSDGVIKDIANAK
jgi:hypothetical protein